MPLGLALVHSSGEIVDGLDVVWVSTDGLSVATGLTIYVWGDNTGASQPAVGAAFGRNAVWVDLIGSADFYSPVTSLTNKTGSASGSVNGSPTLSSTSPFGSSWNFTSAGGSDYVDVLSGFAPSFASNFSISTVFSFDSVTIGSDKRIWGAENTALNENLAVGINTDTDTATKLYSAGETAGYEICRTEKRIPKALFFFDY